MYVCLLPIYNSGVHNQDIRKNYRGLEVSKIESISLH